MARNLGKTFATMDEDDRNRLTGKGGEQDAGGALAFGDPRDPDRMGRHHADPAERDRRPRGA